MIGRLTPVDDQTISETVLTINLVQHNKIRLIPFFVTLDGFTNYFSNRYVKIATKSLENFFKP